MIEDEIKKEFDSYEIKTTSKMILDRMPQPKAKRKLFNLKRLIPAFATLGVSMAALIIIISLSLNTSNGNDTIDPNEVNGTTNVSLTSDTLVSQVALEVLYAGSMDTTATVATSLRYNSVSVSEYKSIVNNIEDVYPLFDNLYEGYDGITIKYEGGDYTILNTSYDYKYTIGEYVLYTNELIIDEDDNEVELEGKMALELNGSYYSGKIELESENEDDEAELEVKMTYTMGSNEVTIEKEIETENNESESSYTYKVEGSMKYEKKVTLEDDNGARKFKYEMENSTNNIQEELSIEESSNGYLIDYNYESDTIDYEAEDIILTINNGVRTYTLDNLTEVRE